MPSLAQAFSRLALAALLFTPALRPLPTLAAASPAANQEIEPPSALAGWRLSTGVRLAADPAQAEPALAPALAELGFRSLRTADYRHAGATLHLRLFRFADASGAYGALTLIGPANATAARHIKIGLHEAGVADGRLFFRQGTLLVEASFAPPLALAPEPLAALAATLPAAAGASALPPPVLSDLPAKPWQPTSLHYALGPASYAAAGGRLPTSLLGFDHGAELVTATYAAGSGEATLTLIDFPTPQLAAAAETRLRAALLPSASPTSSSAASGSAANSALELGRSGPLVAIVGGSAPPAIAHQLLAAVHFDAELVNLPLPHESEVSKTARLLTGIAVLVVVAAALALVLGLFFGGFRALYRLSRGLPASSLHDAEFIHLELNPGPAHALRPAAESNPSTSGSSTSGSSSSGSSSSADAPASDASPTTYGDDTPR